MSRREEDRKSGRKHRERHVDSEDDEEETHRSSRRPRERPDRDYYNYCAYEDRYKGWQDIYRPDYYRGGYYSDYGRNYGPFVGEYNGYYDDYRYGNYGYNDYRSDCRTCNQYGRRRGRMGYDPFVYRHEEDHRPRRRPSRESDRKSKRPEVVKESLPAGMKNDMNVFAVHMSGPVGFKDREHKRVEPDKSDVPSGHIPRRRERRVERPIRERREDRMFDCHGWDYGCGYGR